MGQTGHATYGDKREWWEHIVPSPNIDPNDLDQGIRDAVVLIQQGGFRTFTSCEGGRGHSFQHETIGIELEGSYSTFQKKLV